MGRNILRQSTLIIFFLIAGLSALQAFHHTAVPASRVNERTQIIDRHRGINFWSVPIDENESINDYISYFGSGKGLEYVIRSLNRAEPYWDFIIRQLDEKGMPREIIYLPLIESAYRSHAVSRSGATGLWQFMMNSISPYDITVDAWRDDRRDFWRATESALAKLSYNYSKTGDWLLALAAYNCGLNKILRTVKANGINDYWEMCNLGLLPRETRNYIPKLAAIAYLCEDRGKAGIPLSWMPPADWTRIPLNRSIDLRKLAQSAAIPEEILLDAHSELNYRVTPPSRNSYYLKIPAVYKEQAEDILNRKTELISFKRYKIQSGDTLSEIAEWYRIPVSYIKEYNPGIESRYLRIGQILLVPVLDESIPDRPGNLADNDTGDWSGTYTVQPGDSLWKIAMRHKTSPEEIAAGNGLPLETTIVPGMRLTVPNPGE